ncbi:MAG: hypothetical protein H6876_01930 [Hyphomicrobiaceae bacterium]|nr:hypothetical protein [Hyphomicrobiaceae bacterium]MCC0006869.1 hypothetical protein [Hyphomicrobiaceae bacterium]
MTQFKGFSIDGIIERGSITEGDVMKLRSVTYADGRISAEEADALLRLNDAGLSVTRAWNDYFIEAITDFLVNQSEPMGYVTADNASWLIDRVGGDGNVMSRTKLELVINVIDRARWSPENLVSFALAQVRDTVLKGTGALRHGATQEPGTIDETEVELLRRILYAFGGDGNVAVTRAEAEILFDINDALADGPNNPAWTDLFVKAIANVVMSTSSYAVPTREEALRRDAWLDFHTDLSPIGLIRKLGNGSAPLLDGYRLLSREERALDRLERQRIEMIVNEKVTEGEAGWLADRIARDGKVNGNEAALLAYLRAESPEIHPTLKDLIERCAPAA